MSKAPELLDTIASIDNTMSYQLYKSNPSNRLRIGYNFEMYIQSLLKSYNVSFKGNPSEYALWLAYTTRGKDLSVFGEDFEIKYNSPNTTIYDSYLERDWLPRADNIIINDDNPLSRKHLFLLKKHRKRVFRVRQFLNWVLLKLKGVTSVELEFVKTKSIIKRGTNGFRLKDNLLEDSPSLKRVLKWLRIRLREFKISSKTISNSFHLFHFLKKVMVNVLGDNTLEVKCLNINKRKLLKRARILGLSNEDQEFLRIYYTHCSISLQKVEKSCCKCGKAIKFKEIICSTCPKSERLYYCKDCFESMYLDL